MIIIVDDKTGGISICRLTWDDVFLISHLLLDKSIETKNPTIKKHAEHLLTAFESAAKSIIESTGNTEMDI